MARNVFLIGILVLFVLVCAPLITPVAMGGVFALLFFPAFEWLEKKRVPRALAASLLTGAFSVLVLLPLAILVLFSARSALELFKRLQLRMQVAPPLAPALSPGEAWVDQIARHPSVTKWVGKLSVFFPVKASDFLDTATETIKLIGIKAGEGLGSFVTRVPGMTLGVVVVIVSLYFFLVDGRRISSFVRKNSFFEPVQTDKLMRGLATMARSVVMASLLGALAQTLIMLTALFVSGLPNPGLVAFLVFITSFIPLVGSAPVTFGATLVGWAQSGPGVGGVLLAGALVTSIADNLVRPWVLKGGADLHPLVGFIAAFGGLQLLGLSGLFLGPIVAGLTIAIVRLHARD